MKKTILLVCSKRVTFTNHVLSRDDINIVLLSFNDVAKSYLSNSQNFIFHYNNEKTMSEEVIRFNEWCASNHLKIDYFCNPNEAMQEKAQAFAKMLSLNSLTDHQVKAVRNKIYMKQFYQKINIPHAEFASINNTDDIISFARGHGFPLILKPTDSDSCINTYKISSPKDIPLLNDQIDWMVEEYINGKEYQICCIVSHGKVLDTYIASNPAPILDVFEGAINANITLSPSEKKPINAKPIMQKIVSSLGIDRGYIHGEFFIRQDGKFFMSEIAARLSGCEAPLNHAKAYGFDFLHAILDTYMQKEPKLSYTNDRSVGDLLLPVKSGRIIDISSIEKIQSCEGVIDCHMNYKIGDVIKVERSSGFCSGYVHVEGKDSRQVAERMNKILDNFTLITDESLPESQMKESEFDLQIN